LGDDVYVGGTSGRWSQVFINLFVNAAHAIAEGAAGKGTIVVSSEREGPAVVVRVSDDGPGIDPKHLSRVFDSFFTTKSARLGTGLGLSISRDIVRGYGGDISVESPPGRGATFTLRLPVAGRSVAIGPVADRSVAVGPVAGRSVAVSPVAGRSVAVGPVAVRPDRRGSIPS
jgi:signal transduction histidine kinase